MYLTSTRHDIMHGVSLISQYLENPTENHLLATKRIFRYLKGPSNFRILYKLGTKQNLFGFFDSDYAGHLEDRKSILGFVFMMNSRAMSWSSKKQKIVTLSSIEVEFIATASSLCQAVWLRRFLETLQYQQQGATTIYGDNVSVIQISKNSVLHGMSKHIDVRCHFFLRNT